MLGIDSFTLDRSVRIFDDDEAPLRFIDDFGLDAFSSWQLGLPYSMRLTSRLLLMMLDLPSRS